MLGGASFSRKEQKAQCPKVATHWGASCREEIAGVKWKYLYLNLLDNWDYSDRGGFPFIRSGIATNLTKINAIFNKTSRGLEDNCSSQKTRTCLQNYFINATTNDILIFSLGLSYAEYAFPQIDYLAFATAQAITFRKYIEELFPGKVFRFTGANYYRPDKNWTALHREIDTKALWPVWQPKNEPEEKSWYTIDQWEINKDRRHLYSDKVHFPGPLTDALLYQILSLLCPGMGITSAQYKSLMENQYGKLLKVKTDPTDFQSGWSSSAHYVLDKQLLLHAVPDLCLTFFENQIVDFTPNPEFFRKGEDFPVEICRVGAYLAALGSHQVFRMLRTHRMAKVVRKDPHAHMTRVSEWVISVLPA